MSSRLMWSAVLAWSCVASVMGDSRREVCFPDVPDYVTLKCDFHLHSVFSDGLVWPTVRVEEAWREGLDAIALTDHVEYQPHKQDVSLDRNRPFELAADRAREKNILLIKGAEITRETPPGHFNALFTTDNNALNIADFDEQFRTANAQGAFVFWNHPDWQGEEKGRWGPEHTRLFENKWLQGVEICNGDHYAGAAHAWAVERKLTIVGNSDTHEPADPEEYTSEKHRTLTLVFAKGRTLEDLREALNAGRTAVWCGEKVYGSEQNLAPLFAASVRIAPIHHQDKKAAWVEITNRCASDLELKSEGPVKPQKITLPARATSLVRFEAKPEERAAGLVYQVSNWLTEPKKPLEVKLMIPGP